MTETPTDIPPEDPDIEDHAIEMVPPLNPPDPFEDSAPAAADTAPELDAPDQSVETVAPTPAQEIGHSLAAELDEMAVPDARPTATRDLIHEMMVAGAEQEITTDLLREELPSEEYSDADYQAYEAAHPTPHAMVCE
jgi:hypothetical protein